MPGLVEQSNHRYKVIGAFTGTEAQTGPPLVQSRAIFGMVVSGQHLKDINLKYNKSSIIDCRLEPGLLDPQVTGVAFMLMRELGSIPLHDKVVQNETARDASRRMVTVPTRGGILSDTMGFGKTVETLGYLSYRLQYLTDRPYKPIIVLVPSALVLTQWLQDAKSFPDLTFIEAFGTQPRSRRLQNWVSSKALQQAPANLDKWPGELRYVFDQKDARARATCIITTYHTWRQSTGEMVESEDPEQHATFVSNWSNCCEVLVADEGHTLRHTDTLTYLSVEAAQFLIKWIVTATPELNDQTVNTST